MLNEKVTIRAHYIVLHFCLYIVLMFAWNYQTVMLMLDLLAKVKTRLNSLQLRIRSEYRSAHRAHLIHLWILWQKFLKGVLFLHFRDI